MHGTEGSVAEEQGHHQQGDQRSSYSCPAYKPDTSLHREDLILTGHGIA